MKEQRKNGGLAPLTLNLDITLSPEHRGEEKKLLLLSGFEYRNEQPVA